MSIAIITLAVFLVGMATLIRLVVTRARQRELWAEINKREALRRIQPTTYKNRKADR